MGCIDFIDEHYVPILGLQILQGRNVHQDPRPYGLPGFHPNYRKDYVEELNDVFHYSRYDNGANYTLKLKVDYIKHHTSVAFPTILLLKGEVAEIPYRITSKNNPNIVEGVLCVRKAE